AAGLRIRAPRPASVKYAVAGIGRSRSDRRLAGTTEAMARQAIGGKPAAPVVLARPPEPMYRQIWQANAAMERVPRSKRPMQKPTARVISRHVRGVAKPSKMGRPKWPFLPEGAMDAMRLRPRSMGPPPR